MTEQQLRQKLIAQAQTWLGCREADGSHKKIVDVYNSIRPSPGILSYQDPWCAAFVSAAGQAAGLGAILLPALNCDRMIALYKAAGRFEERDDAVPRPGDLIFYDWDDSGAGDCTGGADHVGIVVSVTGNLMKVIEGNKSDAVGYRSIGLNSRYIRGFARPDYLCLAEAAVPAASDGTDEAGAAATATLVIHPAPAAPQSVTLTLPALSRGDRSETVRAAQLLLIGRGYRCGPWGADGEFGAATYGGLYQFQRARGLTPDGVVGPATWRALLGV